MNVSNITNNQNLFVTASNDSTIRIWDIQTNTHLATLQSTDQ